MIAPTPPAANFFFFFKQKTAYELFTLLEFRRVLFRSAPLRGRFRTDFRPGHRREIREGAEEDRHRSRHALERVWARVVRSRSGSALALINFGRSSPLSLSRA